MIYGDLMGFHGDLMVISWGFGEDSIGYIYIYSYGHLLVIACYFYGMMIFYKWG